MKKLTHMITHEKQWLIGHNCSIWCDSVGYAMSQMGELDAELNLILVERQQVVEMRLWKKGTKRNRKGKVGERE